MDDFPERILKARQKAKLTQREAADRLGISPVYLCYLERGTRKYSPSIELLQRFADVYGMTFTIRPTRD